MSWQRPAIVTVAVFALAGCVEESEFGGSGGSSGSVGSGGLGGSGSFSGNNHTGLSLARDVCIRDIEDQGASVVRVESGRELLGRAEIVVRTRRSPVSANTERQLCTFYYNTGLHDTRPI